MRYAMILHNKAHWIFEQDEIPNFGPDPDGNPIVVVDITNMGDVQEGDDYNAKTGTFSPPQPFVPDPIVYPIEPIQPSNLQLSQQLSDLQADLSVAGIISPSSADQWHDKYMNDTVTRDTIKKLVDADIVSQDQFELWIKKHEEMYDY